MENNLEDDTKTLENKANISGESIMVMCTLLESKILWTYNSVDLWFPPPFFLDFFLPF